MLSKEAIERYQQIYERQFGETVSFEQAKTQAEGLVSLVKLIIKSNLEHKYESGNQFGQSGQQN